MDGVGLRQLILDRLIHQAEIVHFNDSSYRVHHETILKKESAQN
jgi:hypothetical protein